MAVFQYSAQGSNGSVITGELNAADRSEALALLGKQRVQPFALNLLNAPAAKGGTKTPAAAPKPSTEMIRLKLPQIVMFTEELSELLGSGIQLEPALGTMERRRELSGVKILAAALRSRIRDGMSFSKAIAATSPSFGSLFSALAVAGEASGSLPAILKRQAEYLRSVQALRSKVLFALIYPAFLIASAVAVTLLFIVYLIPKLTQLLDSTGGTLPLGAKIILMISDGFKAAWWLIAIGGFGLWLAFRAWRTLPSSNVPWSRFLLRVPLFGGILRARFHVQFLETMASLVGSGLPMTQALQLTHQAIGNPYLKREMDGVIRMVAEGVPLSRALDHSGQFPPLLIDMVAVGEQTGKIGEALTRAAQRFDRELAKKAEKLGAIVQPAVVCVMACLVGVMAYIMITSIFQTISGLGSR
jgi:type II secretory pathway component PulF